MKIVPAAAEDLEAVLRLERTAPEAPHWTEAEYRAIVGARVGPVRRCLLLCWHKDELVGFAVGKVVADEAELESVVVRASARRGGAGKALCTAVIDWAWRCRSATIGLEVRASSAGARALYKALGFVEVGRRSGYYVEPTDDAVLMRLAGTEPRHDGRP